MKQPRYLWVALTLTFLFLLAACGSGTAPELVSGQVPTPPATVAPASSSPQTSNVIAAGEFQLPAASSFGEPGFHTPLSATHELTAGQTVINGKKLVLRLWDADRPGRTCDSQHPLSGCATVDWSDAPGRPNVPSGGVFENSISLQIGGETRRFFLSESGDLRNSPDAFDPG